MSDAARASINPARRALARAARATLLHTVRRATVTGRPLPGFLLLGAQRAGTTSLWRWLAAHPQVVPPVLQRKGVHYFDLAADRPLWWYRAHFPHQRVLARTDAVTGEASPYYLFHPRVPGHVAATLPDTRFVVLLRDPVGRAVSHYHHMRDEGTEPLPTLEAALDAEEERLAGAEELLLRDPAAVHEHHLHHAYVARGRYAEQLRRWFDAVGRERVLVLDGGRLRDDAAGVLAEVCAFVGIDPLRAPTPTRGVNAGSYAPPAPATLERLRTTFAAPDRALWELLGVTTPWW